MAHSTLDLVVISLFSTFTVVATACSSTATPTADSHDAGASADGTHSPSTDSGADAPASGGATSISGSLGDLGDAKATVSSLVIANSGETLIYLSSAAITCEQLTTSRWLGGVEKGAQVVEVVIKGTPKVGTIAVPPGEVNYAEGGRSSAYEVTAESGVITFTSGAAKGPVEGTFSATYAAGNNIDGSFHAEFCDGGQGY